MNAHPRRRLLLIAGLLLGLLLALQLACNMPSFGAATATPTAASLPGSTQPPSFPSATIPPAVLPATQTPLPSTATAQPPAATATLKPITPTPVSTQTATAAVLYKGFLAYDQKTETITGYDFSGAALNIKIKISGADYLGLNEAQWSNNSIYYVNKKDKSINQIALNGAAQKLGFIPAKSNLHFLISPDGKKIAWSFDTTTGAAPSAELWLANIDGSGAKKIAQFDAANNPKWMVVQPYRWLDDGRLLYIDAPTGIGGYILFYGFAGLHAYDPASGSVTNLTPAVGVGALCLREVSPDLKTVLSTCVGNQSTLTYISLADNKTLAITRLTDQNQAGSPAYSPSGAWLAYAFARAEPGNETGKIALVAGGASLPKVIDTVASGYFNVSGWISENQFLAERFEDNLNATSIWLYTRDPAASKKLATGMMVGFIR